MGRKVFISALGASFYHECVYGVGDFESAPTRFVQEAMLEYMGVKGWTAQDQAIFLLTEKVRTDNWDKNITTRKKWDGGPEEPYIRLERVLENMQLPCPIKDLEIPDGRNEAEIWDIFARVYAVLEEGDELYFDITHGFRYLPMLVLVLGNYARFLKGVVVRAVGYGNFEMKDEKTGIVPLVDLMPLIELQDWTYAAGQFLESGEVKALLEASKKEWNPRLRASQGRDGQAKELRHFSELLEEVVNQLRTVRGKSLIEAKELKALKQSIVQMEQTDVPAFNPIYERIRTSFDDFVEEGGSRNGWAAAKWCYEHGLYQQAATFLQESLITRVCEQQGWDTNNQDKRDLVTAASKLRRECKTEEIPAAPNEEEVERYALAAALDTAWADSMFQLSNLRNDFNHAAMRDNPARPIRLIEKVKQYLHDFATSFSAEAPISLPFPSEDAPLFLNISNHPYSTWSEEQLAVARNYGDLEEWPFPAIDADSSEKEVDALAKEHEMRIVALATRHKLTVHVMGELSFSFALVQRLKQRGIRCVASCSNRDVEELEDGSRHSRFRFVRFREYKM